VNIWAHSPFSWPSMPAPNASVGIRRFTGWSAEIMAESTSAFSAPDIDVATVNWKAAETIAALRSHFASGKTPDERLFTARYLIVDSQEWKRCRRRIAFQKHPVWNAQDRCWNDLQCGGACCWSKQPEGRLSPRFVVNAVDGAGPPSNLAQVN